jgi:hypothetical protein
MYRESFEEYLARIDQQIQEARAKKSPGLDRRQKNQPLPEGMEDRRKLADRRKGRQGVREKEKQE